jgi:hypothetical protein
MYTKQDISHQVLAQNILAVFLSGSADTNKLCSTEAGMLIRRSLSDTASRFCVVEGIEE